VGRIYPRAGHIGCEIPNLPVAQILVSKDPAGRTAYVPIGSRSVELHAANLDQVLVAVEVMTWMVPAGNVRFENVAAPRSMAEAAED
jgi:hypothetical protein